MAKGNTPVAFILVVVLSLGLALAMSRSAGAIHEPADTLTVSAADLAVMQTQIGPGGGSSGPVTLLRGTLTTATATDLILSVTAESALWTTVGADTLGRFSQSVAQVAVWIEIDAAPVPVSPGDDGRVVFNNRDYYVDAILLPPQILQQYMQTRAANAFNWIAVGMAPGAHTVEVKAVLDVRVTGTSGAAQASVGKRTLVAIPAKVAPDVTI